jgi:deazaflavin-dependent oxidoreductase (nitroreductase family)
MQDHNDRAARQPSWPTPHGRIPRWLPLFNRLTRFLLAAGIPMGPNALVTIRGRKSGQPRTTPMAVIEVSGRRWIWAPSGEVQWVRNLRAAGRATITARHRDEEVTAVELDPAQRVGFFRDTLGPFAREMPLGLGLQFYRLVDRIDLNRPLEAATGRAVFELHTVH